MGRGVNRQPARRRAPQPQYAYCAWALLAAGAALLLLAGCTRRPARDPILSRPAVAPDASRIAFTGRGRVWITEPGGDRQGGSWRATSIPGGVRQDRPVWLPGGQALALSVWFAGGGGADLAVYTGGELIRLTTTAGSELLDDVAPDGRRLVCERAGSLVELAVGPPPAWEVGAERVLGPGRDARYTPDGQHLLFVRGNESEPLGVWRQGYAGGDDSEIYLLDLTTLAVRQITDNPDNDECPLPLDDAGRSFIVCRERGGPYRPWLVQAVSSRLHRVRRFPMPESAWPVLFPALQRRAGGELELLAEANGRLVSTAGAVRDTGLAFAPARAVRVDLAPAAGGRAGGVVDGGGAALFAEVAAHVAAGALTAEVWKAVSPAERRRVGAEMAATQDRGAQEELLARLLGRLRLPGLALARDGGQPPAPAAPDTDLAQALADSGFAYVPAPHLDAGLAALLGEVISGLRPIVLDLRGARGGTIAPASLIQSLCTQPRNTCLLVDEKTYGSPEILANGVQGGGCARLIGRPTAGALVVTESYPLAAGGVFVMPVAEAPSRTGGPAPGQGVGPDIYVPPPAPGDAEPAPDAWLTAVIRAARGARRAAHVRTGGAGSI